MHCLPIERGERLIVASDGIAEACDAAGAAFGETRLEALLAEPDGADAGAPALVMAALDRFRGDTPLADDASIVEIRFSDALFGDRGTAQDCDLDSVMG